MVRTHERARHVPELLAGPIDPASVQSDAHIIAHGPGILRLVARSSDGTLLGAPFELRVRDERGRVPDLVADFDAHSAPEGASRDDGAQAAQWSRLLEQQRAEFARMREEDREQSAQNFAAFGGLVDRVIAAMGAQNGATRAPEADGWWRKRLETLEQSTQRLQQLAHERELEIARLKLKRQGDGDTGFSLEDLAKFAPLVLGLGQAATAAPAPAPAAPAAAPAQTPTDPDAITIAGHAIPSPDLLERVAQANPGRTWRELLEPAAVETLRSLHRRRLLPPRYGDLLGDLLGAA